MRAKPPTREQFEQRVNRFRAHGATDLQVARMVNGVVLSYKMGDVPRYSYLYHNFLYGHNPEGRAKDSSIKDKHVRQYGRWLKEITA